MTRESAAAPGGFSPGFRLSGFDVAILVLGALGAVAVACLDRWTGTAVAWVVTHFFPELCT
jgi:hypothetical protein